MVCFVCWATALKCGVSILLSIKCLRNSVSIIVFSTRTHAVVEERGLSRCFVEHDERSLPICKVLHATWRYCAWGGMSW